MSIRDRTAIVGIGATPYYERGASAPQGSLELAGKAVMAAVADAGLTVPDVDGFASFARGVDTTLLSQWLGIPEVRFTSLLTGGGGGSAGAVGLASAAIVSGLAEVVVCVISLQQIGKRFGAAFDRRPAGTYTAPSTPQTDFVAAAAMLSPGQAFAMLAARHMHLYGTRREHFAEVAISTRDNAVPRQTALRRTPLTADEYFDARMIADPLCLYDFTLETDGAVAVVVTSAERARDLPHPPVYVMASAHGGSGAWGSAIAWFNMPDDIFASSGHRSVAADLYTRAGVGPEDIDVAELYDHFTPMVLMQLEDYGFCPVGESGPFVADGSIRFAEGKGRLPVNTHGGNLSEAYILGMTHVTEAVEQLRGTAVNQVPGAEIALVTGGPAPIPVSGLILRR